MMAQRPSPALIQAATEEMHRIARVLPGLEVRVSANGLSYWVAPEGQGELIEQAQELLACWFYQSAPRDIENNPRKVLTASEMRL